MKSVMISIQPKWVEKIASGEKTIEVRRTRPKIATPFKCYVYCTKHKPLVRQNILDGKDIIATGKVIGHFVCDRIDAYPYDENIQIPTPMYDGDESCIECGAGYYITCGELKETCLTNEQFENYGKGKILYGWHISDLVIYDEPKELSEFIRPCDRFLDCITCKRLVRNDYLSCDNKITRPPRSWCYVEEKE